MTTHTRDKAIEYVTKAVANLRRALTKDIFLTHNEQNNEIIKTRRTQQEENLEMWEHIFSLVVIPHDPAFDELHLMHVQLSGKYDDLGARYKTLMELYDMVQEQLKKYKHDETCIDQLREMRDKQCMKGTWDQGEYMRGMANAFILAMCCFTKEEPKFFEALSEKEVGDAKIFSTGG